MDSNLIFVGTIDSGVYVSTNGGETWSQVNDGLPATGNITVAVDTSGGGIAYAGTGGASIYKRQFK